MEASAFEMPQILISRSEISSSIVATGGGLEKLPKLMKEKENANIVNALCEIAIGTDYEDGSSEPSIMGAAYSKVSDIVTILIDNAKTIEETPDIIKPVEKVLSGIFQADEDGTNRLNNTVGDESGGEITNQTIETKVSTDEEGHTSLLISFAEKYKEQSGNASISIPLSSNLEVVDHKQAKIQVQSGTLSNDSFAEIGKRVVNAANQAAVKFQIYAKEADSALAKAGLFKKI